MESWIEKDHKWIHHPFSRYAEAPGNVAVVSASGASFTLEDGTEILDAISSWWVNLHGHAHPHIAKAIAQQAAELEHVMFAGITHKPAIELAGRLLGKLGDSFGKIFYSDNGSTAVEVALKLAIQYYRNQGESRQVFVAMENGYHGDTFGAMSVSERDIFVKPFRDHLFSVRHIQVPQNAKEAQKELERFEAILQSGKIAGFIFEPLVQGAGGMRMYNVDFLAACLKLCKHYHVLTLADEVMTGFGRTGKWFAFQHTGLQPDLVCLSKGLTGGFLPMGVTAYSKEMEPAFSHPDPERTFYHGHSFTANPISCAAALASLELLENPETWNRIAHISDRHKSFVKKAKRGRLTYDIRCLGTILAIEFKDFKPGYFYLSDVREKLIPFFRERKIWIRPLGNIIYTIPPYCISDDELNRIYTAFQEAIEYMDALNSQQA